jgi:hypothetical protein
VVVAFGQTPIQSDGCLDLMALPVRDLLTSLGAEFSGSAFDRLAEVAPRVLALPATQSHQKRLNNHHHRVTRACGARLGDESEFAGCSVSACADLPTDLRAALRRVADGGST